jgi:hypothetical protein
MTVSASALSPAARRTHGGLALRITAGLARAQQRIADAVLPLPCGHPASTFRGERLH